MAKQQHQPTEPLRGEAAWRAAKKEVAERNEEAYARGRKDRAVKNAKAATKRVENERSMMSGAPRDVL
jgi:hypothetical protein